MAQDRERLQLYKEKCRNYEVDLENLKNRMQQLEIIEQKADAKISALNKIHQEKSKSLMNSITLLKKENRALEKANSGGAQSKLIAQLNKDIQEQEIVINVLREMIDSSQQEAADNQIIKELNKGPPKIKAPSREEMKIEIKKLQQQIARGGTGNKGGKNSLNNSRVSVKQDQNKTNQSINQSYLSEMNQSTISEDRADSIENLIRRVEELKRENDEIKLNLKAEQEIIEKYEDELEAKSEEINELRSAKTDYTVLSKKYEALQQTIQEDRQNNNDKFISNYDNELRVEELEIITQKQQQKIRTQEENFENEKSRNREKIDELQNQINILTTEKSSAQSKFQQQVERSSTLSKEVTKLKADLDVLQKTKAIDQDKNQRKIENLQNINSNLENTLQNKESELNLANQQLTKLKLRLEQTESELDEVKQKGAKLAQIGDLSLITGGAQTSAQDAKELRNKVKAMTKKEIELEDQIEALQQEIQFREQREKVLNFVNKKQMGGTLQEQELKRKYQKEIQQRYESKVRKLIIRVKELENHNQELKEIHNMLESQVDLVASDLSSDISISLNALENIEVNSNVSDIEQLQQSQEQIVQKDQQQLKQKLIKVKGRELELQDKLRQLEQERDNLKKNQPQNSVSNEEYERKIMKMQNEYDKIITQLSNKIADLELQDVRLSKIDSNIGSDILSQQQYNENDIKDIDSNISFSINDIKKQEKSLSQVSSNIDSILMSDQDLNNKNKSLSNKKQSQPQINIHNEEEKDDDDIDDVDLNNISSGISDISGMSKMN